MITISVLMFGLSPLYARELKSGDRQVRLIELYTSESCSSCPPAESWLSGLKLSKRLWVDFVPVAFHVSYWNYLSWQDKFSKQAYSDRQREYNQIIKSGVYTPQVILDGRDFRDWRNGTGNSYLKSDLRPGDLKVVIDNPVENAQLNFDAFKFTDDLICYGAYLENDHLVKITSGENEGRSLKHDFVVIDLFQSDMKRSGRHYSCKLKLNFDKKRKASGKGLAFWVMNKKSYEVIQSTGGSLK